MNRKLKHTPGPWKFDTRSAEGRPDKADIMYDAPNGYDGFICFGIKTENAPLIVAAPEMLECLIDEMRQLQLSIGNGSIYGGFKKYIQRFMDVQPTNNILNDFKRGIRLTLKKIEIIEKATGLPIEEVLS